MIDKLSKMKVVKRNGKKVEFDGSKIALAVKKGFDSIEKESYGLDDVNKIYNKVIQQIRRQEKDSIKIEQIQDLIEQELQRSGYNDVYQSFAEYRERRAKSREAFADEKSLHKFLKLIEKLGLKGNSEENTSAYNNNAYEKMLEFGRILSKEFSKTYLIKKAYREAHENGDIYIHNIEFIPMGTTQSSIIDLKENYNGEEIAEYLNNTANLVKKVRHEQHGEQAFAAFDTYVAPAVIKTFKEELKQIIEELLMLSDFDKFIAVSGIEREIERINTIKIDSKIFDKYTRGADVLRRLFDLSLTKAIEKTEKIVSVAIKNFLNALSEDSGCSINFGCDTSREGQMISKNILEFAQNRKMENVTLVFKVKKGINSKEGEPNYNLLKMTKRLQIMYAFQDARFNQNADTVYTKSERFSKNCSGNLSTTTVNLPRLGLKFAGKRKEEFYQELDEKLELIKDQLLERFEQQCLKTSHQFPNLIGRGIWKDGEKLEPKDRLRRILKQGNFNIGFLGLAECVRALTRKRLGGRK